MPHDVEQSIAFQERRVEHDARVRSRHGGDLRTVGRVMREIADHEQLRRLGHFAIGLEQDVQPLRSVQSPGGEERIAARQKSVPRVVERLTWRLAEVDGIDAIGDVGDGPAPPQPACVVFEA